MFLDDQVATSNVQRDMDAESRVTIFEASGPWNAHIVRFTGPFWERNESTAAAPYFRGCKSSDPHAIARIRVHVEFERFHRRNNAGLMLSIKYRASRAESSALAQLTAGLVGCPARQIATRNVDLTTFVGRRVGVFLRPDRDNYARVTALVPLRPDGSMITRE